MGTLLLSYHVIRSFDGKYQRSTHTLLPKTRPQSLVREFCRDITGTTLRFESDALEALQVSAETYLADHFEEASFATIHGELTSLVPVLKKRVEDRKD